MKEISGKVTAKYFNADKGKNKKGQYSFYIQGHNGALTCSKDGMSTDTLAVIEELNKGDTAHFTITEREWNEKTYYNITGAEKVIDVRADTKKASFKPKRAYANDESMWAREKAGNCATALVGNITAIKELSIRNLDIAGSAVIAIATMLEPFFAGKEVSLPTEVVDEEPQKPSKKPKEDEIPF